MSKTEKLNEDQVFKQEVADDELEAVSGGDGRLIDYILPDWCIPDDDSDHCTKTMMRDIYDGGFPNCAATVEQDSWCEKNDACENISVFYEKRKNCDRSWT